MSNYSKNYTKEKDKNTRRERKFQNCINLQKENNLISIKRRSFRTEIFMLNSEQKIALWHIPSSKIIILQICLAIRGIYCDLCELRRLIYFFSWNVLVFVQYPRKICLNVIIISRRVDVEMRACFYFVTYWVYLFSTLIFSFFFFLSAVSCFVEIKL